MTPTKQQEYDAKRYQANKEEYKKKAKEYYEANKKEVIQKELRKRKEDPVYAMVNRCRRRDKLDGRVPDINIKYIRSIWPEDNCCPIFKTPFTTGPDTVRMNASLDRIDPNKGYVKGNVVVVSFQANAIKNNATIDELRAVVEYYSQLATDSLEQTHTA
jgi:hypothetical protein